MNEPFVILGFRAYPLYKNSLQYNLFKFGVIFMGIEPLLWVYRAHGCNSVQINWKFPWKTKRQPIWVLCRIKHGPDAMTSEKIRAAENAAKS